MELFFPNVAYASRFDDFLINVNREIVNPLITFLFALAVVYFLWGVFEFMMNQANEEKKTSGKNHMLWGVIGITISPVPVLDLFLFEVCLKYSKLY